MSILELPRSSITFDVSPSSSLTARCSYIEAKIPITEEVPSLIVRLDQHYVGTLESYGNTINIGDTVHVWLDRWDGVGPQYNIFNGLVNRLAKDIEGHTPRWYEIEAVGFADHLNRVYVGYTSTIGTVSDIIRYLVEPAVSSGYITIGSINTTARGTYTFSHSDDQVSLFQALNDVSNDKKWEWRVDNQSRFYAHPVGQHTTSITFANNILSSSYEEDGRNIINVQRVLGPDGRTIGSDIEYTESFDYWTTNANENVLQAAEDKQYLDLWVTKILYKDSGTGPSFTGEGPLDGGHYSLKFTWTDLVHTRPIWVRRSFEDPLDLSYFGYLKFDLLFTYYGTHGSNPDITLRFKVRYEVDSNNYYEYSYETSEIKVSKGPYPYGDVIYTGWCAITNSFNLKTGKYDYIVIGRPTFTTINSIYIEIVNPLPTGGVTNAGVRGDLYIDNMWFDGGHLYSFRFDQNSIDLYGERRGKLLYDAQLSSTEECQEIAESIINYYKGPIKRFTSLRLDDIPTTIPLGYISTITIDEVIQPSAIRAVTYTLEDMKLNVDLQLSDVYIPTLDQIISDIKKYVDLAEEDALPDDTNPSIVTNLMNAPLGVKDLNLSKNQDNLINNPRFEINSDGDNIPDSWYPMGLNYPVGSDISIPYRSEDETNSGQWSGLVSAEYIAGATWFSRTLASELFPWDAYSTHYASVWAKSSHDVTHTGTFGVQLVMHGTGPDYTPLSTISITSNQYTPTWKMYDRVFEKADNTPGVKWARLDLVGVKGSANFFDDCIVQRMFGTDGGQNSLIRPLEYSTSSESDILVYSKTWDPGGMPIKYVCTGIQADIRVDTQDGGNYSAMAVKMYYNGVFKNQLVVSCIETDWYTMRLNNDVDVGNFANTLVVEFYIACGNSAHTAFLRNAEVMVSSYSVKTQMKTRYGVEKE